MNSEQKSGAVAPSKGSWFLPGVFFALAVIGAGWGYLNARASEHERVRTANALQLQVLASRLGVAAFEAEYEDFETARRVASEAFGGIANYGIEQGALPRDYADVLAQRDDVIAGIATRDSAVAEQLMALFFGLQVPVDTELDPSHILPATDSALGLEPPRRSRRAVPGADSVPLPARGEAVRPDRPIGDAPVTARDSVRQRGSDTLQPPAGDTLRGQATPPGRDTALKRTAQQGPDTLSQARTKRKDS